VPGVGKAEERLIEPNENIEKYYKSNEISKQNKECVAARVNIEEAKKA
jgi:hypothetical protein